jgi:hypothetical protein
MRMPETGVTVIVACGLLALAFIVSVAVYFLRGSLVVRSGRVVPDPELQKIKEALEAHEARYASEMASLSRQLDLLESAMKYPEQILRDGRLNVPARTQASQLLRAGLSPETAALNLGMATRDLRLLAKVSRLLDVP